MKRITRSSWPVTLAALMLIAIGHTAVAQRGKRGSNGSGWKFVAAKYDANKDGSVSVEEYTRGETAFKTLDTNSDGIVNENDWQGRSRKRQENEAPKAGDESPDFSLTEVKDPESTVTLSDFAGQKPVALLFGSCT